MPSFASVIYSYKENQISSRHCWIKLISFGTTFIVKEYFQLIYTIFLENELQTTVNNLFFEADNQMSI